jgi:hypothetical protein
MFYTVHKNAEGLNAMLDIHADSQIDAARKVLGNTAFMSDRPSAFYQARWFKNDHGDTALITPNNHR